MLETDRLVNLLKKEFLSQTDVRIFLKSFIEPLPQEHTQQVWFNSIQSHFQKIILEFESYIYPGLASFNLNDFLAYLVTESEFSFALKRLQGVGVLYGLEHTRLRSEMINGLPKEVKRSILLKKLMAADVFTPQRLEHMGLNAKKTLAEQVQDITDIGMGHSVFSIDFGVSKWVLKQRSRSFQTFFTELLTRLKWKSYSVIPIVNHVGCWDLSTYLGEFSLGRWIQTYGLSEDLEKKLAQYAAIGDVLGRGDRHFENVIVKDGELYPIDLSYLFCENNEEWLSRYVSAGMSEFSVLSFYIHDEAVLEKKVATFFEVYSETIQCLKKKEKAILTFIKEFYGPSLETHNRCEFVKQRLTDHYVKRQKGNYIQNFSELRRRLKFKQILLKIGERHLQELEAYPVLKMYFYADKDRMSAFFLSQESGYETVFKDIIYLAKRLLDLPESYFSDDVCEYVTVS